MDWGRQSLDDRARRQRGFCRLNRDEDPLVRADKQLPSLNGSGNGYEGLCQSLLSMESCNI